MWQMKKVKRLEVKKRLDYTKLWSENCVLKDVEKY